MDNEKKIYSNDSPEKEYLQGNSNDDNQISFENNENNIYRPYFKVYEALLALLIIIAIIISLGWIIDYLYPEIDQGLLLVITSMVQTFLFIFAAYAIARKYSPKPYDLLGLRHTKIVNLIFKGAGWGIILYFLSVTISIIVAMFYQPKEDLQVVMQILSSESNSYIKLAIVLTILVLAPLGEEIFFRGFFYAALRKRFGVIAAIIVSAAIFSAMHLDLSGFLPLFGVGIGLAMIYQKYQNIWYNIIIHAVFNSISIILFILLINYI